MDYLGRVWDKIKSYQSYGLYYDQIIDSVLGIVLF